MPIFQLGPSRVDMPSRAKPVTCPLSKSVGRIIRGPSRQAHVSRSRIGLLSCGLVLAGGHEAPPGQHNPGQHNPGQLCLNMAEQAHVCGRTLLLMRC